MKLWRKLSRLSIPETAPSAGQEMNILTDPAPKTVTIGGAEVPINSDFRASVRFEMMMEDSSLSELDKTVKALSLYYDTGGSKNSFKPPAL